MSLRLVARKDFPDFARKKSFLAVTVVLALPIRSLSATVGSKTPT
ncbi:hypothetical protein [Haladaptatus sp. DYF46]|nr:hypothetical protein [Haladaptatus sp. DYF46]